MKPFLNQTFISLGVIFFLILVVFAYLFATDAYGIKTMTLDSDLSPALPNDNTDDATQKNVAGGFALSEAQKQALVGIGLDPSIVPNSVSAEQESCFVGVLGAERVNEIKNGAIPNSLEFVRAKSCI